MAPSKEAMAAAEDVELEPCPFCGGGDVCTDKYVLDSERRVWSTHCHNDRCAINPYTSMYDTKAEAIATWNKRPDHTADLRAEVEALRARVAELEEAQRWRNIETEPTFPEVGRLLEGYSDYYSEIAIYRRMRKIECQYCGAWAYEDDEGDNVHLEHDDGCKMLDQAEDWEWQRWYGHMDGLHTSTREDGRWSQSTEPDAWRYFEPAAFVQRIASE